MDNFLACKDQLLAVGTTLLSNPLFLLKPKSTFLNADPFYFVCFVSLVLFAFCYVRSRQTGDCSFVDRAWGIAPPIYAVVFVLHYLYHTGEINERLALMFLLMMSWGTRLSYNLYIKNGFTVGKEDYRWEIVRTWFVGRTVMWFLFDLFFINIYQMVSIFAFSALPLYVVYNGAPNLQPLDLLLTVAWMAFFFVEVIADFQMFEFQSAKKRKLMNREYKQYKGDEGTFITTGLWKYSRHPNYFGEMGQWWVIFGFTAVTNGFNWTVLGVVNLCIIFYKSIGLTEDISAFKYPPYKYYMKRTSQLFPLPPAAIKTKSS